MPLAIYLKNFGATVATETVNHKDSLNRVQNIERLAQIINFFIQASLSQNVAHKYKN